MGFETISAWQMTHYLDRPEYRIVDLRDMAAFESGHIRGALHIPYEQYKEIFAVMSKNKTYILYCERGGSSLMAARWLDKQGYNVLSLNGGIRSWQGALVSSNK